MTKTIRISDSTWELLSLLKIKMRARSINEVLQKLLEDKCVNLHEHTITQAQKPTSTETTKETSTKATRETEHYMEPIAGKRATPEEVFIDVIRLLQMAGWKVRIGSKISVQTLNKAILKVRSSTDMRTARKYRTMFLKMGWLEGSTPNFYELTERGYNLIKSRIRLEDDDPLLDAIPIHELEKKAKEIWEVLKDWGIPSPRNITEEALKRALEEAGVNPVQLKLLQDAGLIRRTDKGYDITI